ncbi:hypothetical protein PVK06_027271 [Gossypium arboreum]|uniref:Putative plant transposon protein domain-containing protein n=1 Tax=Gossypium arboreum TaxID=29729 RepID=A0ABR0NZV2_GOSAR|nr:hypothetical protein PVK06_027271 [Gossypium arboreum]
MARIRQVTETLNWELFCEKRPSVDEELVREFYVNLTSSELTEVPVCGIKVPITSNAINKFFELPDFENNEYSSLISDIEPENLQEILEELTVPCSKWTVSINELKKVRIPKKKKKKIPQRLSQSNRLKSLIRWNQWNQKMNLMLRLQYSELNHLV